MSAKGKIRRICVVRMGGMGDILLATPSVRALSQHFQTTEIDWIVGHGMAPALEGISYLRRVREYNKKGADAHPVNTLRFLTELRRENYDLFVNFHPGLKTFLMAGFAGAGTTLTFHKNQRFQADGKIRHAVEDFAKELAPLGIGLPCPKERYLDWFTPLEARVRANQILREKGVGSEAKLILVNPAASHEVNRWPAPRLAAFLEQAVSEFGAGVRVGLIGGPSDKKIADKILQQTSEAVRCQIVNLAGELSVKELGAVLERTAVFVTGDTGPMHIASAVGTPIVALFGPADPDRTGPVGPKGRDLVVVNRDGLDCVPCRKRTCRRGDTACMTDLPAARVLASVRQILLQNLAEETIK